MIFLLNILNFLQGLGVYLFLFLADLIVKKLPGPVVDSITPESVKRSDGPIVIVVKGKGFKKGLQVILNYYYGNVPYVIKNVRFISSEQIEFDAPIDAPNNLSYSGDLSGLMIVQGLFFGLFKKYATHDFSYIM